MYKDRVAFYKQLEAMRGSKVISYITGDRPGLETQIHPEVLDYFTDHLDSLGWPIPKISLFIYSRGGATLAAWSIVNLIKMFCDEFEVIIPSKAHSAATLMSLGAHKIIMTKQATLSPIDPSIRGPFNPQAQGMPPNNPLSVSVEDVSKYFDLARKEIGKEANLTQVFIHLASAVHPLALGAINRSRSQIQMLAGKMLQTHMSDQDNRKKVIDFLCSDSGSHDYTITRREAKDQLMLPIEKPNDELYKVIKGTFEDVCMELKLRLPFSPGILFAKGEPKYDEVRTLIETVEGGSDRFISRGSFQLVPDNPGVIQDNRIFEGWVHEQF